MTGAAKQHNLGAAIPPEKIKALREALELGKPVIFRNGSRIEYEVKQAGPEGERVEARLLVTRAAGGVARYSEGEIASAYAMALTGPTTKPFHPTDGDGSRFGEDPPY